MMAEPDLPPLFPIPRNIRKAIKVPKDYLGYFDGENRYVVYDSNGLQTGQAIRLGGKWLYSEDILPRF